MATLNEITYNIKNIVEGGVGSDDSNLSNRQIKHMIHVKRAELLLKYTDNGRKTSEACYQIDVVTPSVSGANLKPLVGFNKPEIIVVDNNSTDDSLQIVNLFKDRTTIKVIPINDYTPGKSVNAGLQKA